MKHAPLLAVTVLALGIFGLFIVNNVPSRSVATSGVLVCPEGYICEKVAIDCPSGYSCQPINSVAVSDVPPSDFVSDDVAAVSSAVNSLQNISQNPIGTLGYYAISGGYKVSGAGKPLTYTCGASQYYDSNTKKCTANPSAIPTITVATPATIYTNLNGEKTVSGKKVSASLDGTKVTNLCQNPVKLTTAKTLATLLTANGIQNDFMNNSRLLILNPTATKESFTPDWFQSRLSSQTIDHTIYFWNGEVSVTQPSTINTFDINDWSDPEFQSLLSHLQLSSNFLYKCLDAGYTSNFTPWQHMFFSAMAGLRKQGLVQ
ncbi:MAG: hypothetical protein WCP09_02030 [Candidatus Taylorbacteria bacterium]